MFVVDGQIPDGAKPVGAPVTMVANVQLLELPGGKFILWITSNQPRQSLIDAVKASKPSKLGKVEFTKEQCEAARVLWRGGRYVPPGSAGAFSEDPKGWLVAVGFLPEASRDDKALIRATHIALHKVLRITIPDGVFPKKTSSDSSTASDGQDADE
jgi:hypothetical protein